MAPDERREQLLEATLAVIARDGYHDVTIEAIAREAGVTRPVVYGVFDNLGDLLRTLLERQEKRALSQLASVIPADPTGKDPDQLIEEGILAFLSAVAREPDTWRAILLPPEGTPPAVRDQVERNRATIRDQLESLVKWGLHRWGVEGLDQELVALALQTAAEEAGRLVLTDPGRYPPERLAGFASQLLRVFVPVRQEA